MRVARPSDAVHDRPPRSFGDRRMGALSLLLLALLAVRPAGAQHLAHAHANASHAAGTADFQPAVPGAAVLQDLSADPRVVEVSLVASPVRTNLLPDRSTNAFAYNGRIPGPLLEVREGDRVVVHFRNDLPEPTTVHWHGLHLPFDSDGSPFHPVAPGETLDYVFTVAPGTAGTYWYHPHPHHRTGYQVGMGLYGGIIVHAADDPLRHIPDRLFLLSDNRFLTDGSVHVSDPLSVAGRIDFENGREGDVLFINGQIMPTVFIRSGEVQRWRFVNASAARLYRMALQGHEVLHVGSDGGLFERPLPRNEVMIAPGERVELLVRGTGAPGSVALLETLPYDRYIKQTRPAGWERTLPLLTLRYTDDEPVEPVAIPERLRVVEPLSVADADTTRVIVLSQGLINGATMDVDRVDVASTVGTTEIWEIENIVGMDHPFHLHGFQFQVLDRNGVPEPYLSWKDTVNVPRKQTVRFIVRYDRYPGKWMFHCHILDHEDNGMMGILEVR